VLKKVLRYEDIPGEQWASCPSHFTLRVRKPGTHWKGAGWAPGQC